MPLLPTLGRTVGTGIKAARLLVRGSVRGGAWATRRVGTARARGAANEIGMIRLFDLHALSCAGDTLIAIGLAGTIFFNVPLGEARSKVALYLLITMIPFALLAPVVGPLLDHFRHGRRYALAVTMLGRAFLAYVISDNLFGWGLYPAAFGVLAFSRAYGVARSAAVPRLLPEGVGLSQVGARASVYGTFAGAIVAPIGLLAFKVGPQWSLRVAAIIFVIGMVIALRLPPRADSDPPEAVPQPWRTMLRLGRGEERPLSGRLVISTLIGSACLRLLYGFTLLFLAFVIAANQLDTTLFGRDIGRQAAVGLIGGALAVGTFLSTAAGTRLRIRRPLAMQSAGLTITAGVAVLAALFYNLGMLALFALVTAIFSGISKLAIDASIQERIPERLRASAFAHSETILMIAFVLGGGIGLIPLTGRVGVALAALLAIAAAVRAGVVAARLHNERLSGRSDEPTEPPPGSPAPATADRPASGPPAASHREPSDPWPEAPTVPLRSRPNAAPRSRTADPSQPAGPAGPSAAPRSRTSHPSRPAGPAAPDETARRGESPRPDADGSGSVDKTLVEPPSGGKWRFGRRRNKPDLPSASPAPSSSAPPPSASAPSQPFPSAPSQPSSSAPPSPPFPSAPSQPPSSGWSSRPSASEPPPPAEEPAEVQPDAALAPPGFHVYRPSSAGRPATNGATPPEDDEF